MVSTGAVVGIMVVLCFVLGMLCMFMRWSTITREAVAHGLHQEGELMGASAAEEAAAAAMGAASASRGLDEGTVQSLPLYQLPPTATLLINPEPCPICLASFLPGQFVRVLPACYHTFHLPCIDQWFSSHSNCPLCRSLILPFSGPPP